MEKLLNNLLEEIKDSSDNTKAKFTYDALGRRIEKIKYATPANLTTHYYYEGKYKQGR